MRNQVLMITILVAMALLVSGSASAKEREFVERNCAILGHGIHSMLKDHTTKDGFTDLVEYVLFCGVELRAAPNRKLRGYYTKEVGYEVTRHWGYLMYWPHQENFSRKAVKKGILKKGQWQTYVNGLHNLVVLKAGPEIVNGGWEWCGFGAWKYCDVFLPKRLP